MLVWHTIYVSNLMWLNMCRGDVGLDQEET